jgi:flagellar hook-basal body complex protein FliE
MTNPVNNLQIGQLGNAGGMSSASKAGGAKAGSASFSDTFNQYLDEVNKLQQDANAAVQENVTGKSDDLSGVMVAMQKSDLAFKTLMTIRTKLVDAYEELKNMPI